MRALPLRLLLCQRLFPEAVVALGPGKVPGLELVCLPRSCDPKGSELEALLETAGWAAEGNSAVLVGGGCLAARKGRTVPPELQLACRSTCFHFLLPAAQVEDLLARGAYLVTPGWLADWRGAVAELGLEAGQGPAFFAESCRSIVLLEVEGVADSGPELEAFAAFAGLPWERLPVDPAHFRAALLEEAWTAREAQVVRLAEDLKQTRRRIAEQAALVDLVQRLSGELDEEAIVTVLLEVAQSLFAPARLLWLSHWKGHWDEARWLPPGSPLADLETELRACKVGAHATSGGDGLLLRLEGPDGTMGLLGLGQLAFPNQIATYLGTARTLLEAAQLALGNARNLHGMIRICAWCRKVKDEERSWCSIEDYLQEQSSATFSHGMCPECAARLMGQAEARKPRSSG